MQIFWTDNFNRESVAEHVVETGLTKEQAEKRLEELCATCTSHGSSWYRLAEDDAKPWGGMSEFC